MSSRPLFKPAKVITNGNMSGNLTSSVSIIQMVSAISYTVVWTGTPTGTFFVEVSNDYERDANGGVVFAGNWVPLTLSSVPHALGSSGDGFVDIDVCAAYAMRFVYSAVSGTGTLNVTVCGKVV